MDNDLTYHSHPKPGKKASFGRRVRAGDQLQKGDLYPGVEGWTEIPLSIVGEILRENHPMEIVRPERLAITEGERR